MSQPLVSVVMPVFNSSLYLHETISSIMNQTYTNWELLCVDDGSVDDSASIIQAFQDNRIRYIRNEKNSGIAYSRNRGISEAKGELIAFLDSDDLAHLQRLQRQVERITQDTSVDVIFTRIQQIDVYGNPAGKWPEDEMYVSEKSIKENLPYINCLAQPSAMGKKEVFIEFPYRSEYKDSEIGRAHV